MRGRGAAENPTNRFESLALDLTPEEDEENPLPPTQYFKDRSRSLISFNDSPDVGFGASLNAYRGCEHGCIYCYARPTHEYLGLSLGLDFETKIFVKTDAPRLLRRELSSPRWKPQVLFMSGVTDCYQPAERRLKLTRACLEVLAEFQNPVAIVTKNHLVTRDVDLLSRLAEANAARVFLSVTTLDDGLRKKMEPRTSPPRQRLEAVETLSRAGVPTGVMVAPVIPAVTDSEIPAILKAAREAGARYASYVVLRLPYGVKEVFDNWLFRHFPERREKVLHRISELRGGKLNDPRFGFRMRGEGVFADQIRSLFEIAHRKYGFEREGPELSTEGFKKPKGFQFSLFE